MPDRTDPEGMPDLTLRESLRLAMNDKKLMTESEIKGVTADAAATHGHAAGSDPAQVSHRAAAAPIRRAAPIGRPALVRRIVIRDDPNRRR